MESSREVNLSTLSEENRIRIAAGLAIIGAARTEPEVRIPIPTPPVAVPIKGMTGSEGVPLTL